MKALLGLITILSGPLAILNILGGIVSGIWLAVLGEWGIIWLGFLAILVSSLALGLVLTPATLLTSLAVISAEKGKTFGMLCLLALSNLYVIGIITVWCCGVLFALVKDATSISLIPSLIWSYGIATGPWGYMAFKEQKGGTGDASTLATFLAELAYVVIMLMVIFSAVTLAQALKVFAGFMLVGLVILMTVAYLVQKEMKELA